MNTLGQTSASRLVVDTKTPILDALWCRFGQDGLQSGVDPIEEALCVVEEATLTLCTRDGAHLPVTLPFSVTRVYAMATGLLLVRKAER